MTEVSEISYCIKKILVPNADIFAWEDFGDKGNPCYDPFAFDSTSEEENEAMARAGVLISMPKFGKTHSALSKAVARVLGNRWVTYDWLCKAVGRLLSRTTPEELEFMVNAAKLYRRRRADMLFASQ